MFARRGNTDDAHALRRDGFPKPGVRAVDSCDRPYRNRWTNRRSIHFLSVHIQRLRKLHPL
jgi:hypothetical protein